MKMIYQKYWSCKSWLIFRKLKIYDNYNIPPLKQSLKSINADSKKGIILKAVVDETIVGSVRAYLKDNTCYIGRLLVHPEFQNKGIGKKLMHEIENKYAGAVRFELFTGQESTKNLHLYKSLGYKEFKRENIGDHLQLVYLQK
jgi:ribosomal protein S18 acetylase RimI-like enzyme